MTTDVGTTERKPLTPRQRLKLFERHGGICALCNAPIRSGDKWIDEHMRALGLGGSNDPENRGIAHTTCAAMKTHGPDGDLARIAKAKRAKQTHLGIKPVGPDKPIISPPMPTTRKAAARAARGHRESLEPRRLYADDPHQQRALVAKRKENG